MHVVGMEKTPAREKTTTERFAVCDYTCVKKRFGGQSRLKRDCRIPLFSKAQV